MNELSLGFCERIISWIRICHCIFFDRNFLLNCQQQIKWARLFVLHKIDGRQPKGKAAFEWKNGLAQWIPFPEGLAKNELMGRVDVIFCAIVVTRYSWNFNVFQTKKNAILLHVHMFLAKAKVDIV